MARLTRLAPVITTLPARVGALAPEEARRRIGRDDAAPWRRWYKTARWRRQRMATFERDLFTCIRCHRIEPDTSKLICAHLEPHRGDEVKFWAGPFGTICVACDAREQANEQGSLHTRGIWY